VLPPRNPRALRRTDARQEEEMLKEEIEKAAYFRWLKRDRPCNDDWSDWFAAEAELETQTLDAQTEFDAVDRVLFETLQWIADQEQIFKLWGEPALVRDYRVTGLPIYFIRRKDDGASVKAYLINFPLPPPGAVEVLHPFSGVGRVHRYDDKMNALSQAIPFAYALNLSGRPTYTIAYRPRDMDRNPLTNTTIPYSRLDAWVNTFVHEAFHHYQFYAPDSDWVSLAWGGLPTAGYPVTADNIALYLLEKHALLAGRKAATAAQKIEVLRRVLAIRKTRARLPEATPNSCQIAATSKTHGQGTHAPSGIGQSFTACESGAITSIRIDVLSLENPNARIELQSGTERWSGGHSQNVTLTLGENIIPLSVPSPVNAGLVYAVGIFPSAGLLSLWSGESHDGGEAFFITNGSIVGITPTTSLTFGLTIHGPNYVDRMDRFQERNEGSAQHAARRLFVRSGNTAYGRELLEMLERSTWTQGQGSRDDFFATMFQGSWYETGSTILDLVDEVTDQAWRTTFSNGGNPIALVETLYGPLTPLEIDRLVMVSKREYNWQAIVNQVNAIPPGSLDKTP
jgi:hypothetical protein